MHLLNVILAILLPAVLIGAAIPAQTAPSTTCRDVTTAYANSTNAHFRLQGQVVGMLRWGFVLDDQTGPVIIMVPHQTPFRRGDIVTVLGTAGSSKEFGCPFVNALDVQLISQQAAPPLIETTGAEFLTEKHILKEVALRGVITDAFRDEVDPTWDILILNASGTKVLIWVPADTLDENKLHELVDSSVRAVGICIPNRNGFRRHLDNWMRVASADAITVLTPPPSDPFEGHAGIGHRQVYSGTILASWDERSAFLGTDDGERIEIRFAPNIQMPRPGTHVTVAAFTKKSAFFVKLANALLRTDPTPLAPLEKPISISANQVLSNDTGRRCINPDMHGKTVRLCGKVRKVNDGERSHPQLYIESDGEQVPVWSDDMDFPDIGSIVEVTGVCIITTERDGDHGFYDKLSGFSLALRDRAELKVLKRPAWWTPARFVITIATLLALIVIILTWNISLRVLVERRGRELLKTEIGKAKAELRTEERTRLAVELHDTIAQSLTGVTFELNAADRFIDTTTEKAHQHLAQADRALKSCRDELRNCIWDLRGTALDQTDVNAAIRQALIPHIGNAKLLIRFNVPRSKLTDNAMHILLRIIRELAINAIRHGNASTIRIAGESENGKLSFSVRDDGIGFDPKTAPGVLQGHFGLQGIRERVNQFSGEMNVESSSEYGTKVTISIHMPTGYKLGNQTNG